MQQLSGALVLLISAALLMQSAPLGATAAAKPRPAPLDSQPADEAHLEAAASKVNARSQRQRTPKAPVYHGQPLQIIGLDSSIANAKIQSTRRDLSTAAGHHYHHKHSVHGWLKMGAHTGKKGAFGWHAKYPVGGKGRR